MSTYRLPEDLKRALRSNAYELRKTQNEIIQLALIAHLEGQGYQIAPVKETHRQGKPPQ